MLADHRVKLRELVARQVAAELPAHIGWLFDELGKITVCHFVDLDAAAQRERLQRLAVELRAVAVLHSVEYWFTSLAVGDPRARVAKRAHKLGKLETLSFRREGVRIYSESLLLDTEVEQAEILTDGGVKSLTDWQSVEATPPYEGFRRYLPSVRSRARAVSYA